MAKNIVNDPVNLDSYRRSRLARKGKRPATLEGTEWNHSRVAKDELGKWLGTRALDILVFNPVIGGIGQVVLDSIEGLRQKRREDIERQPKKFERTRRKLDQAAQFYLQQVEAGNPLNNGSKLFDVSVSQQRDGLVRYTDITITRTPQNTIGGFQSIKQLGIVLGPQQEVQFYNRTEDEAVPLSFAQQNAIQQMQHALDAIQAAAPEIPQDAETYLAL